MPDYGPDAEDPRDQERLENEEDDGSGEELIADGMQKYAPLSTPPEAPLPPVQCNAPSDHHFAAPGSCCSDGTRCPELLAQRRSRSAVSMRGTYSWEYMRGNGRLSVGHPVCTQTQSGRIDYTMTS